MLMKKKLKKTTKSKITIAIRKLYMWSPERQRALQKAKLSRAHYLCNVCKKIFGAKLVQVDHIQPFCADDDWNRKIERMFDENNMQVVCKHCHEKKTKAEREKKKKRSSSYAQS